MPTRPIIEKALAVASFTTAVALCFVSMAISSDHDIAANVCIVVAQFLTLTATLLGIDYKLHTSIYGRHTTNSPQRDSQQ